MFEFDSSPEPCPSTQEQMSFIMNNPITCLNYISRGQVCELHVAGYRFVVLDSAFVVHEGFKTSSGFHRSKDMEQEKNRVLFRQFKGELKEKYPESSRRCY